MREPGRAGPGATRSSRFYLRLLPSRTRLLRYLLEAHDNLACISVADRRECVLKIVCSPDMERALLETLREIGESVPFTRIFPFPDETSPGLCLPAPEKWKQP
ncbi:MAG: DUF4911 domain-containing protein [Deltaproteobacteria bacterium]|jgi:hypothetical protein|nr:DUF4911 domain-containing protein [Deltaproteobacteria bacterium]